jgi:hypothetical protein
MAAGVKETSVKRRRLKGRSRSRQAGKRNDARGDGLRKGAMTRAKMKGAKSEVRR